MGADSTTGGADRNTYDSYARNDTPSSFSIDRSGGSESTGFGGGGSSSFGGRSTTEGGGGQSFSVDNSNVGGVQRQTGQVGMTQAPQGMQVDNTGQSAAEGAGPLFPGPGGGQVININPPQQSAQPPGGNNQTPVTPSGPVAPPAPAPAPPAREQQVRQDQTVGRPRPQRSILTIGLAETTRKNLLGI